MNLTRPLLILAATAVLTTSLTGCNARSGAVKPENTARQIVIEYARVTDIETVALEPGMATGAIIGGGVGLATGGGRSGESKAIRTLAGALIGALAERAITDGKTVDQITLVKNNGQTVRVNLEQSRVRSGDCVEIENNRGGVELIPTADRFCEARYRPRTTSVVVPAYSSDFERLDRNGDGRLSWREYRAEMSGGELRRAERLFDVADEDRDGYLSEREYGTL